MRKIHYQLLFSELGRRASLKKSRLSPSSRIRREEVWSLQLRLRNFQINTFSSSYQSLSQKFPSGFGFAPDPHSKRINDVQIFSLPDTSLSSYYDSYFQNLVQKKRKFRIPEEGILVPLGPTLRFLIQVPPASLHNLSKDTSCSKINSSLSGSGFRSKSLPEDRSFTIKNSKHNKPNRAFKNEHFRFFILSLVGHR